MKPCWNLQCLILPSPHTISMPRGHHRWALAATHKPQLATRHNRLLDNQISDTTLLPLAKPPPAHQVHNKVHKAKPSQVCYQLFLLQPGADVN